MTTHCLFCTDLHGSEERYRSLFGAIGRERPQAVFLGGDLLPHSGGTAWLESRMLSGFAELRMGMGTAYPPVFLILGNDDPRAMEPVLVRADAEGLIRYAHGESIAWNRWTVRGYSFVPPTPFGLKDWERYDVSRYVDPGCVSPERGVRTVDMPEDEIRYQTIARDLQALAGDDDQGSSVWLFHSPPHRTALDRAALDGRMVDHVPMDVHVGSVAIRRFIEDRQPLVTLHGHVHESARLMAEWRQQMGATWAMGGAHDGPELALVRFDLEDLDGATRILETSNPE